jgi:hypothetical protein
MDDSARYSPKAQNEIVEWGYLAEFHFEWILVVCFFFFFKMNKPVLTSIHNNF